MMPVKIRKFRPADIDRIIEIEKTSFSAGAYTKKRLTNLAQKYHNDFLVAQASGKAVAYIIAYQKAGIIDFDSLAVDKNFRNLGIGKALVNFVLNKFRKKGLKKASLKVRITNKKAISFFRSLGFKTVKALKRYYKDGTDACLMNNLQ